jgi:hypothetical protein
VDDNSSSLTIDGSVTVSSITANETHIGAIGGHTITITVTPTLTVHATYVSGDFVGTNNTAMTFAGAARANGGTGYVIGALLVDSILVDKAGELWLFDTIPAGLGLDSAAFTISDADALTCIGVIPFTTYYASALNGVSFGTITSPIAFKCGVASSSIFGAFVTRDTSGYTGNDISIRLMIVQD